MFKRYIAVAAAAALTFVAPAAWGATVAELATSMQSLVGEKFEGGITLHAIAAEDNTLVITVNGPAGWREGLTDAQISDALLGGFCTNAPHFFDGGLTARVDSVDDGKDLHKGPTISSCPKPAGT